MLADDGVRRQSRSAPPPAVTSLEQRKVAGLIRDGLDLAIASASVELGRLFFFFFFFFLVLAMMTAPSSSARKSATSVMATIYCLDVIGIKLCRLGLFALPRRCDAEAEAVHASGAQRRAAGAPPRVWRSAEEHTKDSPPRAGAKTQRYLYLRSLTCAGHSSRWGCSAIEEQLRMMHMHMMRSLSSVQSHQITARATSISLPSHPRELS